MREELSVFDKYCYLRGGGLDGGGGARGAPPLFIDLQTTGCKPATTAGAWRWTIWPRSSLINWSARWK